MCELDNSACKIKVKEISINLMQRLTIKADGKSKILEHSVSNSSMPGLSAGEKRVGFDQALR